MEIEENNVDLSSKFDNDPKDEGNAGGSKKKKSRGFQSMNLIYPVYKAVMAKGFNVPTPIQREVIPLVLEGRDVVACSKTGSGKTAAFLIPMINKLKEHSKIVGTRALILSPTRELALQTSSVLKHFTKFTSLTHMVIVGGHGFEGQFEGLASNPDIIVATPGRLAQHMEEMNLTLNKLEMLIIDEADYLFEMGFVEQLGKIMKRIAKNRQTLLFSATIPEELSNFAKAGLKDYVFCKLDSEYSLSDAIKLNFIISKSSEKLASLLYILKKAIGENETSIIFASTKYHVDLVEAVLIKFGIKCSTIYGKMDQLTRKEQLFKFKSKEVKVLVVTDLAARGIDVPFVQNVLHFDYPAKPKIFIHRSGRTARAGRSGTVFSLFSVNETMYISEILLYIGRRISNKNEDLKDPNTAVYGSIPQSDLQYYQEYILNLVKNDIEIKKLEESSNKAFEKFKKSRSSASRASLKNSKEININCIHPLFKKEGTAEAEEGLVNMLDQIKNYKPKMAYLEINKSKSRADYNKYANLVSKMKKNEEKSKTKREKVENEGKGDEGPKLNNAEDASQDIRPDTALLEKTLPELHHQGTDLEPSERQYEGNNKLKGKRKAKKALEDDEELNRFLPGKKQKKSKLADFRHPEYFISEEAPINQSSTLESKDKIRSNDVNSFILAEDFDDLLRNKKKFMWDKTKKKFVKGTTDEQGRLRKDKEDYFMNKDKTKNVYKKWAKKNMLNFQKEGEEENPDLINRAKGMFESRRNTMKFRSMKMRKDDRGPRDSGGPNSFSGPQKFNSFKGRQNRGALNGSSNRGSHNRGSQSRGSENRGSQDRGSQNRGSQNRGSQNRNRGSQNRGSQSKGPQNKAFARREVRNSAEILKHKRDQRNKNLKNMEKSKRRQIEGRKKFKK